jgi:FkbM family methyltransferase
VQIDAEAFAGLNADRLRSDAASWRICYAAAIEAAPGSGSPVSMGSATCVDLLSGSQLPQLSLPASAGILGVTEHWRVDTWLENSHSKERMAATYSRWQLRLLKPVTPAADAAPLLPSQGSSQTSYWSSLWFSSSSIWRTPTLPAVAENTPYHQTAFRIQGGALFADLQVLTLDPETGRLPVPPGARLWVEVGANSRNTLAATEARCSGNEDVFVVSFEPLLGQYCRLTAAGKSDTMNRLGACSGSGEINGDDLEPNGVVLPIAIGPSDSTQEFRVSALDGCSSLLATNDEALKDDRGDASFWGRCLGTKELRRVPTMTLHTLFERLLPEGATIDFLKVDTQGTALDVIRSAGSEYLDRIQAVVVDALIDGSVPLYTGQNTCSDTLLAAQRWGFHVALNGTKVRILVFFLSPSNI